MFKCVASWFVPNSPLDVRNERLYDKLKRLKEELRSVTRVTVIKQITQNKTNRMSMEREQIFHDKFF